MKFIRFVLFIFLSLSELAYGLNNNKSSQEINSLLDKERIKYDFPAISLSLLLPGDNHPENYVSGYYSLSKDKKINSETLFQIGSITKTFTATIIFQLIEDKKINLNDSLGKWLSQYPRWDKITIYDLLHHTSGVYNYSSGNDFDELLRKKPNKIWSLNELANRAYLHPDLNKPGQRYNYTNSDYVLLGLIIEKATHHSIQQVFNDYLQKLDLKNTFFVSTNISTDIKNKIAHGYNRDGTFKFNTDVINVSMSFGQSAGSMLSAPCDILQWLKKLFEGEIISKKYLSEMTKVISENNLKPISSFLIKNKNQLFTELGVGAGIGLIFLKNSGFSWVHAGGTPGYESFYAYNPCTGIYLALAYNVKPKQQLIFINIADDVLKKLNHNPEVIKKINDYQKNNTLPDYCKRINL